MESLGDILKRLQRQSISSAESAPNWVERFEAEAGLEECSICGGRGWVRRDVPVGDVDFGRAIPCACLDQASASQRLFRLHRFSNLGICL